MDYLSLISSEQIGNGSSHHFLQRCRGLPGNLGRQLADSNLLRAALRELPASSPARSLIVAEIQGLEA
ncbi:hypothetical protein [Glutamicibacter halophytocola]|uniref:hypothetical protein n=1 Tax=Glutamicibacter halophytocola TaxID=1933880 RepID=UPI000FB7B0F9|nr:hypothetical protein [Glutamicibacter halophytocola]NQD42046.1 hypothetical protein [Glutamicibacter halophytocola]